MLGKKAQEYKDYYEKTHIFCEICREPAEYHEIFARGMGSKGNNNAGQGCCCPENRIPLCRNHHQEAGVRGRDAFFNRYGLERNLDIARDHHYRRCRKETECSKKS